MKDLFMYLIQVQFGFVLLYAVYRFLLNKNTTLLVQRVYLLGSMVIAFVLPHVQFNEPVPKNLNPINEVFNFQQNEQMTRLQILPTADSFKNLYHYNSFSIIFSIYLIICSLFLIKVLFDLYKLWKSIRTNKKERFGKINFVVNDKYKNPFSFFNFIFTRSLKSIEKTPEYLHELAHVKQLHSIDRLLAELLVPLLWINPFIYLFKKSLIEVHEHLADFEVIRNGYEPIEYQEYLFSQLKSSQYLKMTSNFNYSLTKKRIMMISKNISMKKSIAFTVLSIMMLAGIFTLYGFRNQKFIEPIASIAKSTITLYDDTVPSILPLEPGGDYWIGAKYGVRKHPILGEIRMHFGLDIVAPAGTKVLAPGDGVVIESEWKNEYGNRIQIKHGNEFISVFAHLSGFNVIEGDRVKTGDVIGFVGSTGLSTRPHLHYEIRKFPENNPIKSYNPEVFIKNFKEIPPLSENTHIFEH